VFGWDAGLVDEAPAPATRDGGVLGREVVEGEAVGADGRGADEGEAFRAEEDDAPQGAERADRAALGLGPRLRRRGRVARRRPQGPAPERRCRRAAGARGGGGLGARRGEGKLGRRHGRREQEEEPDGEVGA
jgi:hypothetical protein